MYLITKHDGQTVMTEKIVYVKRQGDLFVETDELHAEGITHGGEFFMYTDGVGISQVDAGAVLAQATVNINKAILGLQ